jgi:hypothetical protein
MEQTLSHAQVHAIWSQEQFARFATMSHKDRLDAVKTGALEDWAATERDKAFDLLGNKETVAATSAVPTTAAFEAPSFPISRLTRRSRWPDPFISLAGGGWIAIVALVSACIYIIF